MFKHYYGYIKFQRFFGVKAGHSVWNDAFIRTRYYRTEFEAREELRYLVDFVLPATRVKIIGYVVESCLLPDPSDYDLPFD